MRSKQAINSDFRPLSSGNTTPSQIWLLTDIPKVLKIHKISQTTVSSIFQLYYNLPVKLSLFLCSFTFRPPDEGPVKLKLMLQMTRSQIILRQIGD